MKEINHDQEIRATRRGGFGGSDAAMVLSIAKAIEAGEKLTTTQRHRLNQLKGIEQVPQFSNADTEAGHRFEDEVAATLNESWSRESVIYDERGDIYENFRVFAHADFYWPIAGGVKECKWTRTLNLDGLRERYQPQLQWYYMLGAESVSLCYCIVNAESGEEERGCVDVLRDDNMIDDLRAALRLIDSRFGDLDTEITEFEDTDIPDNIRQEILIMRELSQKIKGLEEARDQHRASVQEWMESKKATKAAGWWGSVTYTAASERKDFDKKSFGKDHPDLLAAYSNKVTKKAAYITAKFTE
jgi:hypothetical protein